MTLPSLWAVVASSFAVSLALPNDFLPYGSAWIALIAYAPFLWAVKNAPTPRSAMQLGAIFGSGCIVFQNYWLAFYSDFGILTLVVVMAAFAGYCLLLARAVHELYRRKTAVTLISVAALWAVFEFLKSNGFWGFPWGLAAYTFVEWKWIVQISDIFGVSILSFFLIYWNAWVVEFYEARVRNVSFDWKKPALTFAAFAILLGAYGTFRLVESVPSRGKARVVLVQINDDAWKPGHELRALTTSTRLSREGLQKGGVDLVVWSETAVPYPMQTYRPYYERNPAESPLFSTIRSHRAYWLVGNPYAQRTDELSGELTGWVNAAVLLNNQSRIVDYYGKIQQIPFAEYAPLWDVPFVQMIYKSVFGLRGSWELGDKLTLFKVPVGNGRDTMTLAPAICYEDGFPILTRTLVQKGADALIDMTNDSWSQRDSSQFQHFAISVFRAVENRVSVVRATNSGVTVAIDSKGLTVAGPLPSFTEGQLTFDLSLPQKRSETAYSQFGDWIVLVFAAFVIAVFGCRLRQDSRPKTNEEDPKLN